MKWTYTEKKQPSIGDIRVKTKFAFLPICLKGESRWLEKVMVRQQYNNYRDGLEYFEFWDDIEFMEEEQ